LSRRILQTEGVPVAVVAAQMIDELCAQQLYDSAPSWDGKWLGALLRAAGLPRQALRLRKSDKAFLDAARLPLGSSLSNERLPAFVAEVIERTEPSDAPAHRALPDAPLELHRWRIASASIASDGVLDRH
jgi:hypothetical protein